MLADPICDGLSIVRSTINSGLLINEDRGLLIDAPPDLDTADLPQIERVLCTQYRRSNTAGATSFLERGATLTAPRSERHLFEDPDAYWNDHKNRYHLYHERPGPEVPVNPLVVTDDVAGADVIEWGEFTVTVLDTPGPTDGSVSYLVEGAGRRIVFCGDTIYGPGQIYDVYSLQKRVSRASAIITVSSVHGRNWPNRSARSSLSNQTCLYHHMGTPSRTRLPQST